ncbi:MAG: hypothetical protein JWP91_2574 [Fibrobacteres bacterium]|nr:hypothetical protein [Fibrobacterota bacterium]
MKTWISGMACLSASILACAGADAQIVALKGRVLERADMQPVGGATVKLDGSGLTAKTGSDGRFEVKGDFTGVRDPRAAAAGEPYLLNGFLFVNAVSGNQPVRVELCDLSGRLFRATALLAPDAGLNGLPLDIWPERDFLGFARITTAGVTRVQRVLSLSGKAPSRFASELPLPARTQAKVSAGGGKAVISMDKLLPKTVTYASDTADLGDIVLDYPARTKIGVGATVPYGSIMLFDGAHGKAEAEKEMQAKWTDWLRFTPGPIMFKIVGDPEFPGDTNRTAMQTCCPTAKSWGYDDIQAKEAHGDAQLHIEWNAMGKYDSGSVAGENPDAKADCSESNNNQCFFNSGVYIQSRYEIQLQSFPVGVDIATKGTSHSLGSIVNEFTPLANPHKLNGQWQSYDVTFRTARYNGKTRISNGYMSVWWNGVLVHQNREVLGTASGGNSGENMNDTLYGLKLQNETGDVRFRNIWMKKLKIDSTGTGFGY